MKRMFVPLCPLLLMLTSLSFGATAQTYAREIEASWQALIDAIIYGLLRNGH